MQLEYAKRVLEWSAFDGEFGEAVSTSIKLIDEVHKLRYSGLETISMAELDRVVKEVERP